MANAFKCDICGRFFDLKYHVPNAFTFFKTGANGDHYYKPSEPKDCCPDCVEAIKELIESRKPKEE